MPPCQLGEEEERVCWAVPDRGGQGSEGGGAGDRRGEEEEEEEEDTGITGVQA